MQIFNSNSRNNSTTQATTMLPLIKPMKSKSKLRVGSNKKRKYHIHSNNNPHYAHTKKISMTKIEIKPKPFAINCYNNSTEEDKPINKLQILLELEKSSLTIQKNFRQFRAKCKVKRLINERDSLIERSTQAKKNNFLFCNLNNSKGSNRNNGNGINDSMLSAVSQVSVQLSDLDIDELEDNEEDLLNEDDVV